ncbi:MAG: ester cyclase [Marmoricola sp.]|nr:ester cyclase [Marmoricola sp.]
MRREDMDRLIHEHITAEMNNDSSAAVQMYHDGIIHDVVGSPTGPNTGVEAAQGFYDFLGANVKTEVMDVNHAWYGEDFAVIEHQATCAVPGEFLGVPGNGKRVNFRMLHIWEFENDLMSRENVWLDGGSIIAQLTS